MSPPRHPGPALARDERGVSAIEFALVAPLFCLILVAVLEFGNILFQRFEIDGALSAGANYALVNADRVNAADAENLAKDIATVINANRDIGWAGVEVTVNNGITRSIAHGALSASDTGTATGADSCYCPGGTASALNWGSPRTCTVPPACPSPNDDTAAGKYVRISLSMPYSPILSGYGIVADGTISAATLIRTQ